MKKAYFILLLIALTKITVAQNPVQKRDSTVYRNELGLDATNFIKQFLNLGNSQFQSDYYPVYYLTYRRHFKKGNFRAAIGGQYNKENDKSSPSSGMNRDFSIQKSLDLRIGYEFTNKINKRWSVFYGLDFRPSTVNQQEDYTTSSSGYSQGIKSNSKIIGLAPLLGFKFNINERISLSTEASVSLNYAETFSKTYYTPRSIVYPPKADDKKDTYSWYTNFIQPLFLIFTFDI